MDLQLIENQSHLAISLQNFSPAHKTKFYLPWVNDYLVENLQAAILRDKSPRDALQAIHQGFLTLSKQYRVSGP
jgi:hypothetical protein